MMREIKLRNIKSVLEMENIFHQCHQQLLFMLKVPRVTHRIVIHVERIVYHVFHIVLFVMFVFKILIIIVHGVRTYSFIY